MTQAEKFVNQFDEEKKKHGLSGPVEGDKYIGRFDEMEVSNIGYGRGEYKTSKPNILKNDAVIEEILNISEAAETAVGHTIGPYADATLMQTFADASVPVFNTRDGFTIMQEMKYTQPIPNAIFKIIRSTSEYMQEKIGDSTSSGIPNQHCLLKSFINIFNDHTKGEWKFSPVGIRNIATICAQQIIKNITDNPTYQVRFPKPDENGRYSKEDEDLIIKWLTKVATISANNDYDTGKIVAETYRNKLDGRGHVVVTRSNTEEEFVKDSNAFVLPIGLLDHEKMCNTADGFTWESSEPLVAMFDGSLLETDLPGLKKIVQTAIFDLKRPLFIIASSYNYSIAQYLRECIDGTYYNEKGEEINDPNADRTLKPYRVNVAAIVVRNKEIDEQYLFNDIVLMTDAHPFSTELTKLTEYSDDREVRKEQIKHLFGTCEKIIGTFAETSFVGCKPNVEKFDKLIAELNARRESLKSVKAKMSLQDYGYDDISMRIDRLQARTTFFYCGGRTISAKKARTLIVEDATQSVAAAIRAGGVSIGSNMSVSHYIHNNLDKLVNETIEYINNVHINITAASNYNELVNIVRVIYISIEYAFGQAYRYAIFNMYRDSVKTMQKWEECINSKPNQPIVYNIMTNRFEGFDSEDPDSCTDILVPRNTDECLLKIIIENVGSLINVGNMITLMSPDMDLEQLQYEQLKTGAAYMRTNSVISQ